MGKLAGLESRKSQAFIEQRIVVISELIDPVSVVIFCCCYI